MVKKSIIIATVLSVTYFFFYGCSANSDVKYDVSSIKNLPKLQTVEDVINWCGTNLYYNNVDAWDRAPKIESVINDGYGDCKMLSPPHSMVKISDSSSESQLNLNYRYLLCTTA